MNPVAMTIVSPEKENWLSQGLNQGPVLKSAMLPAGQWGSAKRVNKIILFSVFLHKSNRNSRYMNNYLGQHISYYDFLKL